VGHDARGHGRTTGFGEDDGGERREGKTLQTRVKEERKEEGRDETVRLGLGDEREIRGTLYFFLGRARGAHRKDKTRQDKTETMITVRGRGSMETGQGSISSALCHWVLYCMCGGRVR
jgi:hypothetical protein